jgi:hypothetical protein
MPEGVASLLGRTAPWLLTYLLHSSALIAVAWVLERTGMVRRPRSLDALWKAALLGGFVTSTVVVVRAGSTPVALARVHAVVRREVGPTAADQLAWRSTEGPMHVRAALVEPSPACLSRLKEMPSGDPSWLRAVEEACVPAGLDRRGALVLVWLAGAGGLLLLGLRDRRRLAGVLVGASPAGDRVATLAAALVRDVRRRPVVVGSGAVSAPCAVRGRVVLPHRCEREMHDAELTAVLAHELAHLERHDGAWLSVADVVRRVAWIQPLNRVAVAGVRNAAELGADQRTLRHARPLDLARSIHRVAAWALPGVGVSHLAALTSAREGALTRRVRRILQGGEGAGLGSAWPGTILALGLTAGALLLPPVAGTRVLHAVVIERIETEPAAGPAVGPTVDQATDRTSPGATERR